LLLAIRPDKLTPDSISVAMKATLRESRMKIIAANAESVADLVSSFKK
jgi:hypothetical protein